MVTAAVATSIAPHRMSDTEWANLPEDEAVCALAAEGGRLETIPGCDGLVLALDELWAELDELGDEDSGEDEA